jgi:hypothetical protein
MSQIDRLAAAGIDVAGLSEKQREVLASLATEEIDVLIGIQHRLDDVDGDVEGHGMESGGVYW